MEQESTIRLGIFVGLLALFILLETGLPKRVLSIPRGQRWLTNLGIAVISTLTLMAVNLAVPLLAMTAALNAETIGLGLFNRLALPLWAEVILCMILLDLIIWTQHMVFHQIPFLWRLHQVHHADHDIDVTTGIRFHPIEILISMAIKVAAVYLFGIAAIAVLLYEIMLNAMALFTHANMSLPKRVDAVLRAVIVTPDMHRVHHSTQRREHDMNYGNALSLWDRLFGTYKAQPELGHQDMKIGLDLPENQSQRLFWSLRMPFKTQK